MVGTAGLVRWVTVLAAVLLGSAAGAAAATLPREVPGGDPFGSVESIAVSGGRVTASGWAVDPDTASSIIVQMYVDGSANTMAWAGVERPDVAAVYPWAGAAHGFSLSLDVAPGAHRVCVYAINTGAGSSVLLRCGSVVVPGGDPFGSVESIAVSGGRVTASGWAVDPDTASSIIVQMYVDGSANTMAWAGVERPDVAAVYPWAGAAHGFSLSLDVAPGAHRVCVYAINTGPGSSAVLECRLVAGPPFLAYGSLRNGQSGYYLIAGKTTDEYTTRMPLLDLYALPGSSYPYAVPNDGNTVGVVGEVMSIHPAYYQEVLASLDRYERYDPAAPPDNQVYVRELRATREEVPSWVYVAGPRQASYLRSSGILITSGDWLRW